MHIRFSVGERSLSIYNEEGIVNRSADASDASDAVVTQFHL